MSKSNGSFLTGYKELVEQLRKGKPQPSGHVTQLPLQRIRLRPEVFQHRKPHAYTSGAHIKELSKAPQQGKDLTPITIWWDGKGWVCIDGHHRIEAYRVAGKWDATVPVEVYEGSIDNAVARAALGNTRDKLPMGSREKTETAWRLVIGTALSKSAIASASGASERTVATMRVVRDKLLKANPDQDLSLLTWNIARLQADGKEADEVNWETRIEEEAQAFAALLGKHFGPRGRERREAFVRALEIYDTQLPGFLVEQWGGLGDEE